MSDYGLDPTFGVYGPEERLVNDGTATDYRGATGGGYDGFRGAQGGQGAGNGGGGGLFGGRGGRMIGMMVYRQGVRELEQVHKDHELEAQAAATGNVKEYQKAETQEYSGIIGSIRSGLRIGQTYSALFVRVRWLAAHSM